MVKISAYLGETWRTEFYDVDGDLNLQDYTFVCSIGRQDVPAFDIVFNNLANGHVEFLIEGERTKLLNAGNYYGEIFTVSDSNEYTLFEKVHLTLANPMTRLS